jgi:hypothetical protein
MIADSQVAKMIGQPLVSGAGHASGEFAFVYGREGCFKASSAAQKAITAYPSRLCHVIGKERFYQLLSK